MLLRTNGGGDVLCLLSVGLFPRRKRKYLFKYLSGRRRRRRDLWRRQFVRMQPGNEKWKEKKNKNKITIGIREKTFLFARVFVFCVYHNITARFYSSSYSQDIPRGITRLLRSVTRNRIRLHATESNDIIAATAVASCTLSVT